MLNGDEAFCCLYPRRLYGHKLGQRGLKFSCENNKAFVTLAYRGGFIAYFDCELCANSRVVCT